MTSTTVHTLFVSSLLLLAMACTGDVEPRNLDERIDLMIEENRYEEALDLLDDQDRNDPGILRLKEKTHLNFGLYNMSTFDSAEMRTRMNDALRQFTHVLRINPENEIARTNIEQILQVYATIPDRRPEEDVNAGLREFGYNP